GAIQPDRRIHPNDAMRAHPPVGDSDHVSAKKRATGDRGPRRYRIRVRGPIGPTMMQAFPTLSAARRGQDPRLAGSLPDQCALYGVIHELEALGLELLEIRCLPTVPRSSACEDRDNR
ncbi:MAG: hypothetical protein ACRDNO_02265, partial [Trebonia sp.]